jgi:hypothetical protein
MEKILFLVAKELEANRDPPARIIEHLCELVPKASTFISATGDGQMTPNQLKEPLLLLTCMSSLLGMDLLNTDEGALLRASILKACLAADEAVNQDALMEPQERRRLVEAHVSEWFQKLEWISNARHELVRHRYDD